MDNDLDYYCHNCGAKTVWVERERVAHEVCPECGWTPAEVVVINGERVERTIDLSTV